MRQEVVVCSLPPPLLIILENDTLSSPFGLLVYCTAGSLVHTLCPYRGGSGEHNKAHPTGWFFHDKAKSEIDPYITTIFTNKHLQR